MRYPLWVLLLIPVLIVLHLNVWMWTDTSLLIGLPVNLLYHVVLCLLVAVLMFFVVRRAWPLQ